MNRWFLLLFLAFGIHAPPRPNIVFIRVDNLEIGDMKCFGEERGRIETPHLDRLAAEGLRFTDAHVPTGGAIASADQYRPQYSRFSAC